MDKSYETIYTIKIPPGLYEINGEHRKLENFVYVRTHTLTAPPVADDEVRDAFSMPRVLYVNEPTERPDGSLMYEADAGRFHCQHKYILAETMPADWHEDSSLKTWFPITSEEIEKLRAATAKNVCECEAKFWCDKWSDEVNTHAHVMRENAKLRGSCDALVKAMTKVQTISAHMQSKRSGDINWILSEALAEHRKTEGGDE